MGRRSNKRPWGSEHRRLNVDRLGSVARSETGPDGVLYQVQYLPHARKEYVCPACLQAVTVGAAHVVAWPQEAPFGMQQGVEGRRHWHPWCWKRRLRPL
ncbi:hypothetical protein G7Y41_05785 [Schaalia sp. ZJ405]|uniref:hypothetical protein n=1 Tax=unclassified Schaalia TaxID=2691889 RepID=UPI0013E9B5EC|nr:MULTISPECIES: hypothetical protein [unclassified Schaalia]QPK80611.1 hypothetical protein G7Y41_05785 [Schaalia sp. ZJ405]